MQIAIARSGGFAKVREEYTAIIVAKETVLAIVAANHDVLRHSGKVDARKAWHACINADRSQWIT